MAGVESVQYVGSLEYSTWKDSDIQSVVFDFNVEQSNLFRRITQWIPTYSTVEKIKNTWSFVTHGFNFFERFEQACLDNPLCTEFSILGVRFVLLSNPSVMRAVLAYHRNGTRENALFAINEKKPTSILMLMDEIFPAFEAGPQDVFLACDDEMTPLYTQLFHAFFQPKSIGQYEERIKSIVREHFDQWAKESEHQEVNLTKKAHELTADVIGRVFLGSKSENRAEVAEAVQTLVEYMGKLFFKRPGIGSLTKLYSYCSGKDLFNTPKVNQAKEVLIAHCKALYEQETSETTIISKMKEMGFTEGQIQMTTFLLLIAGQETTAGAIASMLFHCAKNPQLQEAYLERQISADALIAETLRKMPPAAAIGRIAKVAFNIIVVHNNGSRAKIPVHQGDSVAVCPAFAGLQEEVAGENPQEFHPGRYGEGDGQVRLPSYLRMLGSLPLGSGPNACKGFKVAENELLEIIHYGFENYVVSTSMDQEPSRKVSFTAKYTEDIFIKIEPRFQS